MLQDDSRLGSASESPVEPLRIELLGGFRLSAGAQAIDPADWRLGKSQILIKMLALAPGHRLHREQVIDTLWPDLDPDSGTNNLNQALHVARRVLARLLGDVPPTAFLRLDRQMVSLEQVVPLRIDLEDFEQAARDALPSSEINRYYRAIEAYSGDLLPEDRYEDWAAERRESVRQQFLSLLLRLAALHEERREAAPAVDALRRVVAVEPEREEAHVALMRLYALTGRRQQAMRQFERLSETLAREFDSEPDPATQKLYAQILDNRFATQPWEAEATTSAPPRAGATVPQPPPVVSPGPRPRDVFVNRESELAMLRRPLQQMLSGHGRVAVVSGEPGIGKTRLVQELARHATDQQALVVWGRCIEHEGAPAFWPWDRVFRDYFRMQPPDVVREDAGGGAPDIARIAPQLHAIIPDLPTHAALDPSQEVFRIFESVTMFLRNAAQRQPLVIVLDDLQWADQSSLRLLEFVAGHIGDSRVLIVCTYRNVDIGRDHPLTKTLARLNREALDTRVSLVGLDEPHVRRFSEARLGQELPTELLRVIHRQTEGNPFYIAEVVRLLADEGRVQGSHGVQSWSLTVPQSVREAIALRLDRLSQDAYRMLSMASVIGREFSVDVLSRICALTTARTIDLLEEALASRVLTEVVDHPGRCQFGHLLIQQMLYEEISLTRRTRLHREIAEAIETLAGANVDAHLADLAYHFVVAAPLGDVERAIEYTTRAGDQSMRAAAYSEAAGYYNRALDVLALRVPLDERRRCALLLSLGSAQMYAGDSALAKSTFLDAVEIARRYGAPEELARAALGAVDAMFQLEDWDERRVSLLEEALRALGGGASLLRVQVLRELILELGRSYDTSPDRLERIRSLSALAEQDAQALGDLASLTAALLTRHFALRWLDSLEDRLATSSQALALARQTDDIRLQIMCHAVRIDDFVASGDMDALDQELDSYELLARQYRLPHNQWAAACRRAMRAILAGSFDEGERLAREALSIGQRSAANQATATFAVHLWLIRREQDRLTEVESEIAELARQFPFPSEFHCYLNVLFCDMDRRAEARALFERLAAEGFADMPRNFLWLPNIALLSEVCAFFDDRERAAPLFALLVPYAGRNVSGGGSISSHGASSYYLGILAVTLSDWATAERHLSDAITLNERMGAWPFLADSYRAYAEMLRRRDRPEDGTRAREHAARASDLANEYALARVLRRLAMVTY